MQSKDLMFSISKNPRASMAEVLAKVEKYINGEEALISKKGSCSTHKEKSGTDKRQGQSPKRQRDRERSPKTNRERSLKRRGSLRDLGSPQPELQQRFSPRRFTPLTAAMSQVLRKVQHEQFLRWPSQMRLDPAKRDNTKYLEFHREYGHRTDDCIQLRPGSGSATTTTSAGDNSTPAALRGNPCDLWRIFRRRGVQLC